MVFTKLDIYKLELAVSIFLLTESHFEGRDGGSPKPQFKPQSVYSIEIVTEQPFVANKPQVFV